jgi:hypothetical protein
MLCLAVGVVKVLILKGYSMPTYEFINESTKETFEAILSMAEREEFLLDHPNIRQLPPTQMNIVSGVSGKTHKNDDGWKETLDRISAANPASALADQRGGRSSKEAKTAQAVEKWRKKRPK